MSDPVPNRRLLLVDDEVAFARTLAKRIALRGYACDVAHDGREGLRKLHERSYFALLLDLRLPDLSGQEVLPLALEARPGLPVVIVTAHGNPSDEADCLAGGAVAFLNKPIRLDRLIALLSDLESVDA
jgi:DNA-binding NtrC family response regulator